MKKHINLTQLIPINCRNSLIKYNFIYRLKKFLKGKSKFKNVDPNNDIQTLDSINNITKIDNQPNASKKRKGNVCYEFFSIKILILLTIDDFFISVGLGKYQERPAKKINHVKFNMLRYECTMVNSKILPLLTYLPLLPWLNLTTVQHYFYIIKDLTIIFFLF